MKSPFLRRKSISTLTRPDMVALVAGFAKNGGKVISKNSDTLSVAPAAISIDSDVEELANISCNLLTAAAEVG